MILGKHSSGYLIPLKIKTKTMRSAKDGMQFIAYFESDRSSMNTETGFIQITKEKRIEGISASCINLLGFDLHAVRKLNKHNFTFDKIYKSLFSTLSQF